MVADPEAAAEVGDPRLPAERIAAARRELGEPADRLGLRGEVRELRSDVDVDPEDVDAEPERVGDRLLRLRGRKAELRAVVAGHDRLVRVRVDAEGHPDETPLDACGCRELRLVRSVEDHRSALGRGSRRNSSSLLFPCTTSSAPVSPAARANASSPAVATSAPTPSSWRRRSSATFGNAFVPKNDASVLADRLAERPRPSEQRLLAVHDERRPEPLGELGCGHPAEGENAGFDARRIREKIEHSAILTVTLRRS